MKKALLLLGLTLLVAAPASAQDAKPNLSGTWNLDVARSDFGGGPAPESIVHVIEHKDPQLKIATTQKTPQGEISNTRVLTTDGKDNVNKMRTMMGEQDVTSTTSWTGKTLAVAFALDIQGNAITINETWDLAPDGKVLTVSRTIHTGQGDVGQKFVFNKQ